MKKLSILSFLLLPFSVFAQSLTAYKDLIKKIQAQEVNFQIPQKEITILVGDINVNNNDPIIKYVIPIDTVRHIFIPGTPIDDPVIISGSRRSSPSRIGQESITDTDRTINIKNNVRFNLRFTIKNWLPSAQTLTVGIGSKRNTVSNGASEIVLSNVLEADALVKCYTNDPKITVSRGRKPIYTYNNVLHINWSVGAAGIITLPVLPVKIIYAPIQDFKKQNTASVSSSTSKGSTTAFSISTINNITAPVETSLSSLDDILKGITNLSNVLSKVPDAEIQAAGKALGTTSTLLIEGLGSQTLNRTVSNSVTTQNSYAINESESEKITAKSSNGTTGDGDVICFYTDVQLIWVSSKGKMELSVIGYNPTLKTPSAAQLKTALISLQGKPQASKDTTWNIDAGAIRALLDLDPFTGPQGPKTQLDPLRFSLAHKQDGSLAIYQNGGMDRQELVSHQVTSADFNSKVTSSSTIEIDKPGFLSFLGLGETNNQTLQSTFSRTSTSQTTLGSVVTQDFTLHGDGFNDHYYCAIYYDNVFGTFAFRDNSADLDDKNIVQGVLKDNIGQIANVKVLLKSGNMTFWSRTDNKGQFIFKLPYKFKPENAEVLAISKNAKFNLKKSSLTNLSYKSIP